MISATPIETLDIVNAGGNRRRTTESVFPHDANNIIRILLKLQLLKP